MKTNVFQYIDPWDSVTGAVPDDSTKERSWLLASQQVNLVTGFPERYWLVKTSRGCCEIFESNEDAGQGLRLARNSSIKDALEFSCLYLVHPVTQG